MIDASKYLSRYLSNTFTQVRESSLYHQEIDLSIDDFEPEVPFRGIHCNVDSTVVVVGVDDNESSFVLTQGTHPIGGIAIRADGTSPGTGLIALF